MSYRERLSNSVLTSYSNREAFYEIKALKQGLLADQIPFRPSTFFFFTTELAYLKNDYIIKTRKSIMILIFQFFLKATFFIRILDFIIIYINMYS